MSNWDEVYRVCKDDYVLQDSAEHNNAMLFIHKHRNFQHILEHYNRNRHRGWDGTRPELGPESLRVVEADEYGDAVLKIELVNPEGAVVHNCTQYFDPYTYDLGCVTTLISELPVDLEYGVYVKGETFTVTMLDNKSERAIQLTRKSLTHAVLSCVAVMMGADPVVDVPLDPLVNHPIRLDALSKDWGPIESRLIAAQPHFGWANYAQPFVIPTGV